MLFVSTENAQNRVKLTSRFPLLACGTKQRKTMPVLFLTMMPDSIINNHRSPAERSQGAKMDLAAVLVVLPEGEKPREHGSYLQRRAGTGTQAPGASVCVCDCV